MIDLADMSEFQTKANMTAMLLDMPEGLQKASRRLPFFNETSIQEKSNKEESDPVTWNIVSWKFGN